MGNVIVSGRASLVGALPAIVPAEDKPIEPWYSIVHWTELRLERESGKNRGYTKWIVPVTCGRRASPECRGKRDVIVLRGMGGTELLTPDCLTGRGNIYSGVCLPCLKVKDYPALAPGCYVCLGDDNEDGMLFKCGGCGKLRRRRIKEPKKFTGLCLSCGQRAASGSKTVSEGENKGKLPFNCANCGVEAFAWPHQHKSVTWKRLCPKCQKPQGAPPPWGWNALAKNAELPFTKAPVYFGQRKFPRPEGGGKVKVQCVFPVLGGDNKICGEETEFNFKVLRRNWEDATGFCPQHEISRGSASLEIYRAAVRAILMQAQNDNGQKNLAHRERDDRGKWLLEIIIKIAARWRKFSKTDDEAERQDNLARIKQEYIADDLDITVTGLRGRLDECGWREMFPNIMKRFPALVAFVAERVDREDTTEQILSDLRALTEGCSQKSQ